MQQEVADGALRTYYPVHEDDVKEKLQVQLPLLKMVTSTKHKLDLVLYAYHFDSMNRLQLCRPCGVI